MRHVAQNCSGKQEEVDISFWSIGSKDDARHNLCYTCGHIPTNRWGDVLDRIDYGTAEDLLQEQKVPR